METMMMLTLALVLTGILSTSSLMVVRQMQVQRVKEQRLRAFVAR